MKKLIFVLIIISVNLALSSCAKTYSKITDSKTTNLIIENSTATGSTIDNSTLEDSHVTNSKIFSSKITENSKILDNSTIRNSTIENSKISNSINCATQFIKKPEASGPSYKLRIRITLGIARTTKLIVLCIYLFNMT